MSEISRELNTSSEMITGPDLFQYYIHSVTELLSGNDLKPSSIKRTQSIGADNGNIKDNEKNRPVGFAGLFCNAVGDGISCYEKTRLMTMLRQIVVSLNSEADEMMDPVLSMHRLRGLLAPTNISPKCKDAKRKVEIENCARKKLKVSSREGSPNKQKGMAELGKSLTRCNNTGCVKYAQKSKPDEIKSLCGDCSKQTNGAPCHKDTNGSLLRSSSRNDKENGEVNDDLQVLLVNRGPKVAEKMEKHAAELSATLERMEKKLEELLDTIISSCRPMTLAEKHQLRRLIENLPSQNLNRVVEIIQRGKPPEKLSKDTINVDLQHEDDVTLWRIYFYVKAVENAQKFL